MGPWMMRSSREQYQRRLARRAARGGPALGVEFIPCQMTMDMFGLTRDDLIEGMGEPVGAATDLGFVSDGAAPIFI